MEIEEIKCPACGSTDLQYDRDSSLTATVVWLKREGSRAILVLEHQPQPEWLDAVRVLCHGCGKEVPVCWDDEHPANLPEGKAPLDADMALDRIAASAREGGDVLAVVQELVPRTGRLIEPRRG